MQEPLKYDCEIHRNLGVQSIYLERVDDAHPTVVRSLLP